MKNDRFVQFFDLSGVRHTVRLIDIQGVGVSPNQGLNSYVRANDFLHPVTPQEAERVERLWTGDTQP